VPGAGLASGSWPGHVDGSYDGEELPDAPVVDWDALGLLGLGLDVVGYPDLPPEFAELAGGATSVAVDDIAMPELYGSEVGLG